MQISVLFFMFWMERTIYTIRPYSGQSPLLSFPCTDARRGSCLLQAGICPVLFYFLVLPAQTLYNAAAE